MFSDHHHLSHAPPCAEKSSTSSLTRRRIPCSKSASSSHRFTLHSPLIERKEANLYNITKIGQIQRWTRLHAPPRFLAARSTHHMCGTLRLPFCPCHVSPTSISDPWFSWLDPRPGIFYFIFLFSINSKKKKSFYFYVLCLHFIFYLSLFAKKKKKNWNKLLRKKKKKN